MKAGRPVRLFKYTFVLLILILAGCTRTVTFYDSRHVSGQEPAILEYSFITQVRINQKEPVSSPGSFVQHIRVKLLPKAYHIEWAERNIDFNFIFHDSGTLHAQSGRRYIIKTGYLPGQTRLSGTSYDKKYFKTEVLDAATWIEDADTHEVVVGTRPPWVNSTEPRPQIIGL